jgi:hypothetical protein
MLIFTVAYKRGLRAQSWGSNFWENNSLLSLFLLQI